MNRIQLKAKGDGETGMPCFSVFRGRMIELFFLLLYQLCMKAINEKGTGTVCAFCMNVLVVILEIIVFSAIATSTVSRMDLSCLKYYTHYSSFLTLVSSSFLCVSLYRRISGESMTGGRFTRKLRFMAVSSSALTMVVVLVILIPMSGFRDTAFLLFGGTNLLEHILCPVLSIVSFIFFGDYRDLGRNDALQATLPTIVYAFITVFLNATGLLEGPYPFLLVKRQPLWLSGLYFTVIAGGHLALANALIILAHNNNPVRVTEKA